MKGQSLSKKKATGLILIRVFLKIKRQSAHGRLAQLVRASVSHTGGHPDRIGISPTNFPMMYYVYVLWSLSEKQFYVGSTDDVKHRLERHNAGKVPSTKRYCPWELVYTGEFCTRAEALRRESEIKRWKNPAYMVKKLGIEKSNS